ncbi:MAG TPA: thiamine-phosphate kinase [Arenimonas sp.]|nr:thiamine-phosphate kinase [Arenimonas sp.]
MSEFNWIAWLKEQAQSKISARPEIIHGIGDDAAVCEIPDGMQLVISTDTLVSGVHFPEDTAPIDIGYKCLAVNLSDIAAMGAEPCWLSMAISLPEMDWNWLTQFSDGLIELAAEHGVQIIGGDTTQGPLSITITVHGLVPKGHARLRSLAKVGDDIWLTGSIGDAAASLQQWKVGGMQSMKLRHRLNRPTARVSVGIAVRDLVHAMLDVSDGLAQDLGHILQASHVGAEIELGRLPVSSSLLDFFPNDTERWQLQLSGGDDYELCFTAPACNAFAIDLAFAECGVSGSVIGHITEQSGLRCLTPEGNVFELTQTGYQHFEQGTHVH